MTDHIPNDELDTIMSEIILEITKADYENPYNHQIDEIDAIVFEIAKDIEINCQLFNIAPHPFQPCRKYKWYFSNPTQYYQVEIKNGQLWIGFSGEYNKGFEMANPKITELIKEWVNFLQQSVRTRITSDREITYVVQ